MTYTTSDLYDFRQRHPIIQASYDRLERGEFANRDEMLVHCVCELAAELERRDARTEAPANADAALSRE